MKRNTLHIVNKSVYTVYFCVSHILREKFNLYACECVNNVLCNLRNCIVIILIELLFCNDNSNAMCYVHSNIGGKQKFLLNSLCLTTMALRSIFRFVFRTLDCIRCLSNLL